MLFLCACLDAFSELTVQSVWNQYFCIIDGSNSYVYVKKKESLTELSTDSAVLLSSKKRDQWTSASAGVHFKV